MTVPTNTFTTYTALGQAEDFSNVINIVTAEQVPFQASVQTGTAYAKFHQWQTDDIPSAANQAVIEGDTLTAASISPTTVLGNYCQINSQALTVSRTEQVVQKYGRADEQAYQLMRIGTLMRQRAEVTLVGTNLAYSAGSVSAGRQAAGVLAYIYSNVDKASDGSNPNGTGSNARTDGTPRPLTQTLFFNVITKCMQAGSTPNLVLCSPYNMYQIQKFDNYTTKMQATEGTLKGTFDAVLTPIGLIQVRYDAWMRSGARSDAVSELMILDTNFWRICTLDPLSIRNYAQTGDTVPPQYMVQEYTLESSNQKASGLVADLNPGS